jgi:alpha/beta superfamily hydrolase
VLHALVTPFLERGYHVVLFNSRGVGKSTKWPSLSALSEAEDLGKLVKVLVKHISEKGSAITQVVLMVSKQRDITGMILTVTSQGYSHGSIPVSHHPTSIQDLSPAITVSHILLSYPLSPMAFLTAFHHNTHAAALQRLISNESARVLVVYGDHDEFTAEGKYDTWSQGLIAGGRKVDIHKVKGANHFWHGQSMSSLLDIVSNWLDLL